MYGRVYSLSKSFVCLVWFTTFFVSCSIYHDSGCIISSYLYLLVCTKSFSFYKSSYESLLNFYVTNFLILTSVPLYEQSFYIYYSFRFKWLGLWATISKVILSICFQSIQSVFVMKRYYFNCKCHFDVVQ